MLSLRLVLAILTLTGLSTAVAFSADESIHVLPKLSLGGRVPLKKIAEYHLHTPRSGAAAVVHGGFIYIIGGANSFSPNLASIERFDPQTGRSEAFASLAKGRVWHRAVVDHDKIYILGGSTKPVVHAKIPQRMPDPTRNDLHIPMSRQVDASVPSRSVEILDLVTGKISGGPSLPEPRNEFACVVAQGKLYVIGGQGVRNLRARYTNLSAILDLATHKWSSGPLLPSARESQGMLIDDNFIVVPGGYDGTKASTAMEAFDIAEQTWRGLPPLVQGMSAHAIVHHGHHLFLFGNYDTPGELLAYNLGTKTSEVFTLDYTPARHTAAVIHNGRIYVIGGRISGGDAIDLIQVFEPTGH